MKTWNIEIPDGRSVDLKAAYVILAEDGHIIFYGTDGSIVGVAPSGSLVYL